VGAAETATGNNVSEAIDEGRVHFGNVRASPPPTFEARLSMSKKPVRP
jgi:hypothetical protein